MKLMIPNFLDLLCSSCYVQDMDEFEEFKNNVSQILFHKCKGLIEAVTSGNQEMWFVLLDIDSPDDKELEYYDNVENIWDEIVNLDQIFLDDDCSINKKEQIHNYHALEHNFTNHIIKFCKMMITNQKMTQEISRLVISATSYSF